MASTADLAFTYCHRHQLHLVPLPPKTKRPLAENWGHNLLSDPDEAWEYFNRKPDWNVGVALGPSRLCSLDVDDLEATQAIFAEFGWRLDELVSRHPTIQGRAPGMRVMFRVPDGVTLKYHALTWPKQGQPGRITVFEIRAADDQQRQDVFPPSIHPDTGAPYVWLREPADEGFPEPPEFLLRLWENWDALKPQLQAVCPWAERKQPPARAPQRQPQQGGSVITEYDQRHSITDHLARYGYRQQGKRWLSPHSKTGLPGVMVFEQDNRCYIHHASDPLCSVESGQPVGPFDLFCHYEHGGDMRKAVRAAGEAMGMKQPKPERQAAPRVDPETGEILPPPAPANDNVTPPADPKPLNIFAEFAAPGIELGMLPRVIADYALECGELVGVDPAMVAMPALVACAAALHDDVKIQPKRHETGWTESARLWCAIVGSPSVKKSPAIRRGTKRLRKIDHDLAEENARKAADYATNMEVFKDTKKEAKKAGLVASPPEKPAMHRMVVEDITIEALSEVLKDNSRGVLCIQDELSGWFGSMDAYSGGKTGNKDRAAWLQAYNGGFRQVDRVMRGSVHIPNFSVSMIGGIQPDAIRRIAKDMTDDGLMQRFMIVIGRNAKEHDRMEQLGVNRAFGELVDHLYGVQPGSGPVMLSEGAHIVRERLLAYAAELADYAALPSGLRSHLGKWSGLFARLLLVYHAIECAEDRIHPCDELVSQQCAEQVERLMRGFLLPHAIAYYTDILGASGDLEHARWVAGHILSKGVATVSNRDLVQSYKQWRGMDDWGRQRVMQVLEDAGWVWPFAEDGKPARRGASTWVVNGHVHQVFAQRAADEAERRGRIRAELAAMQRK